MRVGQVPAVTPVVAPAPSFELTVDKLCRLLQEFDEEPVKSVYLDKYPTLPAQLIGIDVRV